MFYCNDDKNAMKMKINKKGFKSQYIKKRQDKNEIQKICWNGIKKKRKKPKDKR